VLIATVGGSAYWYLTRSTGVVALLLLTAAVALGVADVQRLATERWPRFVIDAMHRNVSLLSLAFICVHIITTVLDPFAAISPVAAVVPFSSSYRPLWLGLGAVAFDLLLAVTITSLARRRLGHRSWRVVHWLTYASWPVALLHSLGTGTDVKSSWLLVLALACTAIVVVVALARIAAGWPSDLGRRIGALASVGALVLLLGIWLPSGPLGREWARRSGTPTKILSHSTTVRASSSSGARS
jgi:methionine sulfoxide reductase heme-binding subunit